VQQSQQTAFRMFVLCSVVDLQVISQLFWLWSLLMHACMSTSQTGPSQQSTSAFRALIAATLQVGQSKRPSLTGKKQQHGSRLQICWGWRLAPALLSPCDRMHAWAITVSYKLFVLFTAETNTV
jgi:hypothetical protein